MSAGDKRKKAAKPNSQGYFRSEAAKKRSRIRHEKHLVIAKEYKIRVQPLLLEKARRLGFVQSKTERGRLRNPSITQLRAFIKMMDK